jgi:hypothetical protein
MNLQINFNFEGGQNFDVVMSNAELKRFLTTINKSEVYWDDKGGFWLAFNKLLYFTIKEIKNELEPEKSQSLSSYGMVKESPNLNENQSETD